MARIAVSRQRWEELAEAAQFDAKRLANLCGLSRRQLERKFRLELNRTPEDWLNERRIVVSRRLLMVGLSVKAVAIELGFKQTSHFCRRFKALHQITPTEFVLNQSANGTRGRPEITGVVQG